ncbi:MAG TPA: recombinase family protein [Acidimicrobiales bacterium]|nr:recombinase family protein [Acidimicrobiales bacterium]
MSLYGGMSKGERNRIKIRVRSAMAAQAQTEGRYLGGRPPYGYRLADAGPHPNPGKASHGQRLRRLEVDPTAAPVVERIFTEYLAGRGLLTIAERLTREDIPSPSAHDPARNRHRLHAGGAWSKAAIRAILTNPRYTGRQVWNKQRRDEVLIDIDDVALGHETRMRWNDPTMWVWSIELVHEPLITPTQFEMVQGRLATHAHLKTEPKRRTRARRYVLSGLVTCGLCNRRMQGSWNHGAAHYRCTYANEYARARGLDHPKAVYVKESAIVPRLDAWILDLFDPANLDATCAALASADGSDDARMAVVEAARRRIADCDDRLAKYRAALDAGADPAIVARWIADVRRQREEAAAQLDEAPPAPALTKAELKAMLLSLKDLAGALRNADPADKAELYAELGIRVRYEPGERVIVAQAQPTLACSQRRVGGPMRTRRPRRFSGPSWRWRSQGNGAGPCEQSWSGEAHLHLSPDR